MRRRKPLPAAWRKTLNWYLHNRGWWERVMDGRYREWLAENYGGRAARIEREA